MILGMKIKRFEIKFREIGKNRTINYLNVLCRFIFVAGCKLQGIYAVFGFGAFFLEIHQRRSGTRIAAEAARRKRR